jgi:hypothetical protein
VKELADRYLLKIRKQKCPSIAYRSMIPGTLKVYVYLKFEELLLK